MAGVKKIVLSKAIWSDVRGWGINPFEAAALPRGAAENLHVVSLKPGAQRGNHHHPGAREWLLVLGGSAKVAWRLPREATVQHEHVADERPALFEIAPNIDHAVLNTSEHDIYLVAFTDSPDPDTVRTPPLFK